jgi:integrase
MTDSKWARFSEITAHKQTFWGRAHGVLGRIRIVIRRMRSHATLLGEVGGSLKIGQALLGHSDLETTLNVYTHSIPDSQKAAVG